MPLTVVRTKHILLRPWTREDVDALHALWTTAEVRRYLWDDAVIIRDTAEQVVESHLVTAEKHSIGYWALHIPPLTSPAAAPIAGFCGFRLIGDSPEIELMYGLQPEYWGKGLATEACLAALGYLWRSTEYQQVYARTDPPNQKSVQVMLRLGMTHESTTESMICYVLRRPIGPTQTAASEWIVGNPETISGQRLWPSSGRHQGPGIKSGCLRQTDGCDR